jgi:glycosyltransferase involved in cell wall biosynthesis
MATLGIFTVKNLSTDGRSHWTYGGFGDYLRAILPYFERVVLVAHVAHEAPGAGYYRIDDPRLEVVPLPVTRGEHRVLLSLPRMIRIARATVARVDVVHARMPDYTGIVGAFAAQQLGVPCFNQIVADWGAEAQRMPAMRKGGLGAALKAHLYLYDWFERRACRGQLVFAQGESCHAKHAGHSDAHLVVSSAHDEADIVVPPERFARRPFRMLNVARLTSVKNQPLLVRALRALIEHGEDWVLTLVGDGPQRASLEAQASKLGIAERVTFAGLVEHGPALWPYFDAADVFVLPSRSEGTPKVLLEAMARGLPVVASNVSGIPTLVRREQTGLLFEDDDLDGLLACLHRYQHEPALRRTTTAAGSQLAAERTAKGEMARMMEAVFARWPHLRPRVEADDSRRCA